MALGSRYHLFKRRVLVKGKRVIRWYYWYTDAGGKRVQRSAKSSTKAKAQEFIEQLDREDERTADAGEVSLEAFVRSVGFFGPDCPYLLRRREKDGVELKPHTLYIHRHNVEKYIIPMFGSLTVREIDAQTVEDGLIGLDRSSAARNLIIQTLRILLREAVRRKLIAHVPEMEQFRRQSKRYDTLTDGELETLFPEDREKLRELWRNPRYSDEPPTPGGFFSPRREDGGGVFSVLFMGVSKYHLTLKLFTTARYKRRSNADKRRAVETLLHDAEWNMWSDSEIARRCGVNDKTVAKVRSGLTSEFRSENQTERAYTTKHGTTSTMNTSNIGRKPEERVYTREAWEDEPEEQEFQQRL